MINFKTTKTTPPRQLNRGGQMMAVNVTNDNACATITTRYNQMCATNIITLAHYPMTAVLYQYD